METIIQMAGRAIVGWKFIDPMIPFFVIGARMM
jgi:hypothetical protein